MDLEDLAEDLEDQVDRLALAPVAVVDSVSGRASVGRPASVLPYTLLDPGP